MPILFAIVAENGDTPSDHPKLDAYKYMALLQRQGRLTSLTCAGNDIYTVESVGLAPVTFRPMED